MSTDNKSALPLPEDRPYFDLLEDLHTPMMLHRGGPILFMNKALEKITGYPRGELLGVPFYNLLHPDSRELARQRGAARLSGESAPPVTYEIRLQTVDERHPCWVELTVSLISMNGLPTLVAAFSDQTEQRLAADRHDYFRQCMAQVIDGNPVPIFVLDAEHKVTHWNRACAVITGKSAAEMVGTKHHWMAFYPSERPVMADLVLSGTFESGIATHYQGKFRRSPIIEDAYEAEDFFPQFGDQGCWLYFTAAPIRDTEGRIVGAIETLQDVSARREAEAALRENQAKLEALVAQRTCQLEQANEQLMQSEKLASIGQLAAGVAHEINNPIGYVHSNIGALENYIGDLFGLLDLYEAAEPAISSPEQAAAIKARRQEVDVGFLKEDIPMLMHESREGITRVKKIVQDLKDFSHVDSTLEWQWANLHHGIDSTLNVVNNEIKYKADVVKEYGDLPDVECLPSQLNQVFMNLMVNAAHAMGERRGQITVRTGRQDDSVWLEFADNGSGIPEAIQAKIFDPFFTTKPVGKGTGLGLSLSYGIILKHNGSISVKSKPGEGTLFRIVLPIKHIEPRDETPL